MIVFKKTLDELQNRYDELIYMLKETLDMKNKLYNELMETDLIIQDRIEKETESNARTAISRIINNIKALRIFNNIK